jgi:two-component system, OmpR family, phosphate regulon sensor histidine kinase PhoR
MTNRIFRIIFTFALCAAILASGFIMLTLYQSYTQQLENRLKTEAGYLLYALSRETDEAGFFKGFFSDNRITLVATDGNVLYDNTADAKTMGNHLDRPEIQSALKNGSGKAYRFSDTLSQETLYFAIRTDDGNILRLSNSQSSVLGLLFKMLPVLLLILLGVGILSFLMARVMAKRIVSPINTLNLDQPLENDVYDELSPLLSRMQRQREELEKRMQELTENRREFAAVTQHMREGMVFLSGTGDILSINESAAVIFGVDSKAFVGKPILLINRSVALQHVVDRSLRGESAEEELRMGDRNYQLIGNPVEPGGGARGAVILALDVTDRESAERSRREFTANVSHELKTPLTSITGYAEIMKNGTARPDDMQSFASRIYDEATRLIALIEDVMRLSRLDEKIRMPEKTKVDLLNMAETVVKRLQPLAERRDVTLSATGEHLTILGYEKILEEMVYNLCDNAIKYNVKGGSVDAIVREDAGHVTLTVRDTGIGIPPEHQARVFERFYRVDHSHARETGGTGLGLSIVKHSAAVHGATVSLTSQVAKGTKIVITFPAQ